jgi:hypothetical protein
MPTANSTERQTRPPHTPPPQQPRTGRDAPHPSASVCPAAPRVNLLRKEGRMKSRPPRGYRSHEGRHSKAAPRVKPSIRLDCRLPTSGGLPRDRDSEPTRSRLGAAPKGRPCPERKGNRRKTSNALSDALSDALSEAGNCLNRRSAKTAAPHLSRLLPPPPPGPNTRGVTLP